MSVPNSDAENNKFDASDEFFNESDVHMARDARAASHDGKPAPRPAHENEGSDAGGDLPAWIG
jgi:hypothetical protein